jgi:hypothetical protein
MLGFEGLVLPSSWTKLAEPPAPKMGMVELGLSTSGLEHIMALFVLMVLVLGLLLLRLT